MGTEILGNHAGCKGNFFAQFCYPEFENCREYNKPHEVCGTCGSVFLTIPDGKVKGGAVAQLYETAKTPFVCPVVKRREEIYEEMDNSVSEEKCPDCDSVFKEIDVDGLCVGLCPKCRTVWTGGMIIIADYDKFLKEESSNE